MCMDLNFHNTIRPLDDKQVARESVVLGVGVLPKIEHIKVFSVIDLLIYY